jgi:hypothetical protein
MRLPSLSGGISEHGGTLYQSNPGRRVVPLESILGLSHHDASFANLSTQTDRQFGPAITLISIHDLCWSLLRIFVSDKLRWNCEKWIYIRFRAMMLVDADILTLLSWIWIDICVPTYVSGRIIKSWSDSSKMFRKRKYLDSRILLDTYS